MSDAKKPTPEALREAAEWHQRKEILAARREHWKRRLAENDGPNRRARQIKNADAEGREAMMHALAAAALREQADQLDRVAQVRARAERLERFDADCDDGLFFLASDVLALFDAP